MQVQINTDKNIDGNERLVNYYTSEIKSELDRFEEKITRVEVHLGDENSTKFGLNDKKCLIEVRMANKQPVVVNNNSDTIEKAFFGAIEKAKKVLGNTLEKARSN